MDVRSNAPDGRSPHVVVVGGGFGGLYATLRLSQHPVRVTLIDRENYHLFQPLLYQVATAGLSPGQIAQPIRRILRRHKNVEVLLAEVQAIHLNQRVVMIPGREVSYDYLIVATGASHSYFGHPDWEPLAPGLKSLADAIEIRRRILTAFEAAEQCRDRQTRQELLTFVVIGGGPTGVELAGAIAEVARHSVAGDYRSIDPSQTRIILVEGSARPLPTYPPSLSRAAAASLRKLGVEVWSGQEVSNVTAESVSVGTTAIPTRTVFWAAGVAASSLGRALGSPLDRSGRVLVEPDLTVPGHGQVYVIGDLSALSERGKLVPGVAPAAIQQGAAAADNIWRSIQGQPRRPFHYRNRGNLATIGRGAGVADFGVLRISGLAAWLTWLLVHIFFLIGFENRVLVMIQWMYSYFTYERGARLITHPWAPTRAEKLPSSQEPGTVAPELIRQ